jgi:rubredoxin
MHDDTKPPEPTYKCKFCTKEFKNESSKRKHQIAEHGHVKYPCTLCDIVYVTENRFRLHMAKKHNTPDSESFPCEVCGEVSLSRERLKQHISIGMDP